MAHIVLSGEHRTMGALRVLLVDDERGAGHALARALQEAGYEVQAASDAFEALRLVDEAEPDLTIADLMMPGMDGVELMKELRQRDPDAQVLLLSAVRDVDAAVAAMHEGAFHFFCKPVDVEKVLAMVSKALDVRRLRRESIISTAPRPSDGCLLGSSPQLQAVSKTIALVAPTRASVLITGESGTGKELVAKAIHRASPRASAALVRLNCAALADGLLESELFGHERGAFAGADRARKGRIEQAHGGTLFLNEIGEITGATQVKLLHFLQERRFERIGGNQTISADVRVIAATSRNLHELVARGGFREDLYYRLNVVAVQLPALRERAGDIPLLATNFLKKYADANGRPARAFDVAALSALTKHAWPGNVRELQNVVERAVVLANGELVERQHLPAEMLGISPEPTPRIPGASMDELERYAIMTTLQAHGGSTVKAAATLGISVRKIQYRLQQYAKGDVLGTSVRSR